VKTVSTIFIIFVILYGTCSAQESEYEPGYQLVMRSNPALTGSEGEGFLRLTYANFYPGNSYNLHSVHVSYDSYFPALHGGAGFFISDDYLGGIVNDLRGGLSYSYFLRAGKDMFINAGLTASFYHRGFNFDRAILPDQIDAMGNVSTPSSELLTNSGHTVFDIGAGFLFISEKVFGGFSVSHLTEPDLSATGSSAEKLKRKLFLHISGDLSLNKARDLGIQPQAYLGLQQGFVSAGAGAVISINYLSVNALLITDNAENLNIQTGFSLKSGKMSIYYNYRFNIISGNQLIPLSLLHQAGVAFSLHNVEKRNLIKTINLPKL
jgi:type IX secretion system PorP/SprF family membrane protein